MFKIIKENKVLGIVSNPTWVRMQDNGCYGLTIEDNAQGIALNGTVYHVNGKPDLNGAETVSIEEVDDGIYANSLTALLSDPNVCWQSIRKQGFTPFFLLQEKDFILLQCSEHLAKTFCLYCFGFMYCLLTQQDHMRRFS